MDFEATERVLESLEREGVRYIVIGAAALNLLGMARFTEDLDLCVAPEAGNAVPDETRHREAQGPGGR
jgi:predicted nucleotidyltransferase